MAWVRDVCDESEELCLALVLGSFAAFLFLCGAITILCLYCVFWGVEKYQAVPAQDSVDV